MPDENSTWSLWKWFTLNPCNLTRWNTQVNLLRCRLHLSKTFHDPSPSKSLTIINQYFYERESLQHYHANSSYSLMATEQPRHDSSGSKDEAFTAVCHCGRVRVELPSKPTSLLECHCTVCYKYGALWAYFQRNDVVVTTASDTTLQAYIREDADCGLLFNRCGHCGCMMFWRGERTYAEGPYAGLEHKMGVNCRMLPKGEIEGIAKRVTKGPGN